MKDQQLIAIDNPCYVAEECIRPIYKRSDGEGFCIVTVNSGFE